MTEVNSPCHLQGLRERNWTSPYYREQSQPWKIEIYEDSGRLLAPSWSGFRATVTLPDGSMRWVNMPTAGAETYTHVRAWSPLRITLHDIDTCQKLGPQQATEPWLRCHAGTYTYVQAPHPAWSPSRKRFDLLTWSTLHSVGSCQLTGLR